MRVLKAGMLYFVLVFGAGFVFGTIRTLWIVPMFGTRTAELLETPIMLVVTILAAWWTVRRLAVPSTPPARLGMGFVALGLLLVARIYARTLASGHVDSGVLCQPRPGGGNGLLCDACGLCRNAASGGKTMRSPIRFRVFTLRRHSANHPLGRGAGRSPRSGTIHGEKSKENRNGANSY